MAKIIIIMYFVFFKAGLFPYFSYFVFVGLVGAWGAGRAPVPSIWHMAAYPYGSSTNSCKLASNA